MQLVMPLRKRFELNGSFGVYVSENALVSVLFQTQLNVFLYRFVEYKYDVLCETAENEIGEPGTDGGHKPPTNYINFKLTLFIVPIVLQRIFISLFFASLHSAHLFQLIFQSWFC